MFSPSSEALGSTWAGTQASLFLCCFRLCRGSLVIARMFLADGLTSMVLLPLNSRPDARGQRKTDRDLDHAGSMEKNTCAT